MRNSLLACATAMLLPAGPAALAADPIDSTGQENFVRYCAACHGSTGHGDGPVAAAIASPIPDLTRIAARHNGKFPRSVIQNAIDGRWRIDAHGTQQMPVWGYEFWVGEGAGDFSEARVNRILAGLIDYLESIQEP